MAYEIQTARVRARLPVRINEPYWRLLKKRGQSLGFRKIAADRGSWIARMRPEDGGAKYDYEALGDTSELSYEQAYEEAEKWFKRQVAGVKTGEVVTVADACAAYVKEREKSKSTACAQDAKKRFERTVYTNHFGRVPLVKLRAARVRDWRDGLELAPGSANRTLTTLKAALNLAVRERHVSPEVAIEWGLVKPLPGGNKRRDLFLGLAQRRAFLKAAKGAVRDLIEATTLTGARAGELVNATVSQFDERTKSMTFIGKTGTRTVPVSTAAVKLFKRLATGKDSAERLLVRDDGKPWAHSDWDQLVRAAAAEARLPAGTVLYTLRHSFITAALTKGLSTLDVARLVGTSVMMIEKHYGHLVASAARERLAKIAML